jgi:hypothetical protein
MLYEIGDYYYRMATGTHYWGGAPETDPDELKRAGLYYNMALAKGYRPKTGYDHLLEYCDYAGDYAGYYKKQEAIYTSLVQAFPDSVKYWFGRAINRQHYKDYQGQYRI